MNASNDTSAAAAVQETPRATGGVSLSLEGVEKIYRTDKVETIALSKVNLEIAGGRFSPGDPHRYKTLVGNLYDHDYFLVTSDFDAYFAKQREIDKAYQDTEHWTKMAILNTARMGWFSSDRTIAGYARDIWNTRSLK